MEDDALRSIGELARAAGLPVRTIRFWSDAGLVPPTGRTPAGYRLYDEEALARLRLVRTLRDLGLDLPAVRQVLRREVGVPELAAVHAEAVQAQIRTLRLHQAVLRAAAARGSTAEELEHLHRLAGLSGVEQRALLADFTEQVLAGFEEAGGSGGGADDGTGGFPALLRGALPRLPEDPTAEQAAAWLELAELMQDEDVRAGLRSAAAGQAVAAAETGGAGAAPDPGPGPDSQPQPDPDPDHERARQVAALVRDRVGAARAAGTDPASPAARPVLDEVAAAYAGLSGRTDDPSRPEFRAWLSERLEAGYDPRYERYWQLLAVLDGRPAPPSFAPDVAWLTAALRAH